MLGRAVLSVTTGRAAREHGIAAAGPVCEPDDDASTRPFNFRDRHTMTELGDSLERMSFMQLLLLFGFVTCYVVALGGLFGSTVRLRAAALALLQAVGFAVLTDPWVHGALLVVFVVAGLGLFVMLSWLLARLLAPRQLPPPVVAQAESAPDSTTQPPTQPQRHADALSAVSKLSARRARATR
jgi:hypothetical protein